MEKDFQPDPQLLSFAEAEDFEENPSSALGITGRPRYLAKYFGPAREAGEAIPLIYLAIQLADAKELGAPGKLEQILTAARNTPNEFGIHPDYHVLHKIRQAFPRRSWSPYRAKRSTMAMA